MPRLRINALNFEELQKLPQIGPVRANAILAYRSEHGNIRSAKDLESASELSPKQVKKLLPFLSFMDSSVAILSVKARIAWLLFMITCISQLALVIFMHFLYPYAMTGNIALSFASGIDGSLVSLFYAVSLLGISMVPLAGSFKTRDIFSSLVKWSGLLWAFSVAVYCTRVVLLDDWLGILSNLLRWPWEISFYLNPVLIVVLCLNPSKIFNNVFRYTINTSVSVGGLWVALSPDMFGSFIWSIYRRLEATEDAVAINRAIEFVGGEGKSVVSIIYEMWIKSGSILYYMPWAITIVVCSAGLIMSAFKRPFVGDVIVAIVAISSERRRHGSASSYIRQAEMLGVPVAVQDVGKVASWIKLNQKTYFALSVIGSIVIGIVSNFIYEYLSINIV